MERYQPTEKDIQNNRFKPDMIQISGDGAFYTLQGEGVSTGVPAVFLRLNHCNLACVWCDTPYTWKKDDERYWKESQDLTIKESADMIRSNWGTQNPDVQKRAVLTGGEPLLQGKKLEALVEELGPDWKIEIETNGTVPPPDALVNNPNVQFNCSPKLDNSGNPTKQRVREVAIKKLATGNTYFKFVVTKPEELDEIQRDYIDRCGIPSGRIILMPEGTTPEALHEHAKQVAEYAKEKGFRMMGRMQVEVWGAKRGV